ncbi:MAG: glucuronate isomerase [Spirochaeta sp.]|nr:glucuronate isomerase [Spirochaeta sp.]
MKEFLNEDFLLHSESARRLYHEFAASMPIYDYHCHLPVREIAENRRFKNLTRIWLEGDHYKWSAMRIHGVDERLITGRASDYEKFAAWAETVPYTVRNPLYHWTHLELKNPFGITGKVLNSETAHDIYDTCSAKLQREDFRARGLMTRQNVKIVCTTDDPVDTLEYHRQIREDTDFAIKVLPAFRADKAMAVEQPRPFNEWLQSLARSADVEISSYSRFIEAIRQRHDFFHQFGCRLSDHGIEQPYAAEYTDGEIKAIFNKVRSGEALGRPEIFKFKSAVLFELAVMDGEKDWTQQFHFGAMRNNNTLMFEKLGPDSGFDAISDLPIAHNLVKLLDRLNRAGKLARTIIYVLNPRDNELVASIAGCFHQAPVRSKIQFGSGWWFNDQKDGMERQLNALSNLGLLSGFVGMLTDSRSFLSYPRHEYFRRILCNMIGREVEAGEIPNDLPLLGKIVQDVCYNNALNYFGIEVE